MSQQHNSQKPRIKLSAKAKGLGKADSEKTAAPLSSEKPGSTMACLAHSPETMTGDISVPLLGQMAMGEGRVDARLLDAINIISETFALWDENRILVFCNTRFQEVYQIPDHLCVPGIPYEDMMGAAVMPIVCMPVSPERDTAHGNSNLEVLLMDGHWLHINEERTSDGGYVSVGTDITRLKRSEQNLAEREKQLQTIVSDQRQARNALEKQTQQLVELTEKYSIEKNRAEEASRTKSEFMANISHELRTPLNAVIGFSEIMHSEMFGEIGHEKYREYARDIFDSGNYLLSVINDILDMSKIEAGHVSLDLEAVEAVAVIDQAMKLVGGSAQEGNITLKRKGTNIAAMRADKRAVKQVMLNLLSNAVKFTPKGGTIEVQCQQVLDGVEISISDDGIGIAPASLQKLGRPFEQVENQFTKSHKGTGLGLSISNALMELHGGTLSIDSTLGKGTKVTCFFPGYLV